MKTVGDVIREKTLQALITTEPTASAADAARLMTRWKVGALPVLGHGHLEGLISERDFVRAVSRDPRALGELCVAELMTPVERVASLDLTTDYCMALMTHLRLRHLPVVEGGHLVGILSIGDLVKDIVGEQTFIIEQLTAYITRAPNA